MKRLLATVAMLFALTSPLTFAATPTTEPSLETGMEIGGTLEKLYAGTCRKHPGKILVLTEYLQKTAGSKKYIAVMTLNGQKVDQLERGYLILGREWKYEAVRYVRNSPGQNWLKYKLEGEHEENEATHERLLSELGLTESEWASCDDNLYH